MTDIGAIEQMFLRTGHFDRIVVTVKASLVVKPFVELDTQQVRQDFDVKFWGQYNLAKAAYKYVNPGGSITLSSGTLGQRPYPGYSTMSAIDGAIESLGRSLAIELAPVRINVVCPGFKTISELDDKIPLGLGTNEQMASAYLCLMNDEYMTGTTVVTDGGALLV